MDRLDTAEMMIANGRTNTSGSAVDHQPEVVVLVALELDEVIAGADAPEPQPGHLHHQPWQLAPDPLGTAVRIEFKAAAFLHPVQVCRLEPESIDGEPAALDRTAENVVCRQVPTVLPRKRISVLDHAVEVLDGANGGPIHVHGHQGHSAVQ